MDNKNKTYKTKQKEIILNYFKTFKNNHITVQEISDYLNKQGNPVGITTIYRHLDKLVLDGVIKRYILEGKNSAYFEYNEDNFNNVKFHLKCNICNELSHFKCNQLNNLYIHFLNEHNMDIDLSKTIYYGTCDKCSKINKEKEYV